jgi:hypothetical protein
MNVSFSFNRLGCFLVAVVSSLASWSVCAESAITWPDLPKACFVSGRPATQRDVKGGCAAFLIGGPDMSTGTPLPIAIPQYAWHVDQATGKKTPVILMQAEEKSGIRAVGYKDIQTSTLGAALLSEMQLLGTKKPE